MVAHLALLFALLSPLASSPRTAPAPTTPQGPDAKEQRALLAEWVALGPRAMSAERERQQEILARFGELPAPDERDLARVEKELAALVADLPGLPKGSGRQFLEPKEKRGLYLVGGKSRSPKGLFVGLHGGGVGEGDAEEARGNWESAAAAQGWLAIFPEVLVKTEHGWTDSGTEEFVLELIERALRTHKLPPDRVFLAGHSMGGYGAWTVGARHADRFAGLVASAGAPTPLLGADRRPKGVDWGVVPNLRNTRMVVFQSSDDPQVTPDANRVAAKEVAAAKERWGGYPFEYWEVDGNGHALPPGGAKELLDKVADARRVARPERVVWQPVLTWKRQFHWLFWETPPAGAVIDASVDRAAGRIEIRAEPHAGGLGVLVGPELVDVERELVVLVNGEERFRGVPQPSYGAVLETAIWGDPELLYRMRIALDRKGP